MKRKTIDIKKVIRAIRDNQKIFDIAKSIGVKESSISRCLKKNKLSYNQVKFNHNFFEKIDNEEKAYWLGFLLADGCIHDGKNKVNIHLSIKDVDHLYKWHKSLKSINNITTWKDIHCNSSHASKKMCQDLAKYGCVPRKTHIIKLPKNIPNKLKYHLIRGYFDGDGCVNISNKYTNRKKQRVYRKTGSLNITFSGTHQMMIDIRDFLNLKLKLYLKPSRKTWVLRISGNHQCVKIYNILYKNANIYLSRKKSIFDKHIKTLNRDF